MTPHPRIRVPAFAGTDEAAENARLHAEIHHLVSVHRAAAALATALTDDLSDELFRKAKVLVDLLEGALEPQDLPQDGVAA